MLHREVRASCGLWDAVGLSVGVCSARTRTWVVSVSAVLLSAASIFLCLMVSASSWRWLSETLRISKVKT